MTGAKLLGMHETVPSPKSKRSQRVVRRTVIPASCRGAMRTTLGLRPYGVTPGKSRRFRMASRTCGYTGDAGG